jgi:hypothetical protein
LIQDYGLQSGYGFIHFPLTTEGVNSALEAVTKMNRNSLDNVSYECTVSHGLRNFLISKNIPLPSNMSTHSPSPSVSSSSAPSPLVSPRQMTPSPAPSNFYQSQQQSPHHHQHKHHQQQQQTQQQPLPPQLTNYGSNNSNYLFQDALVKGNNNNNYPYFPSSQQSKSNFSNALTTTSFPTASSVPPPLLVTPPFYQVEAPPAPDKSYYGPADNQYLTTPTHSSPSSSFLGNKCNNNVLSFNPLAANTNNNNPFNQQLSNKLSGSASNSMTMSMDFPPTSTSSLSSPYSSFYLQDSLLSPRAAAAANHIPVQNPFKQNQFQVQAYYNSSNPVNHTSNPHNQQQYMDLLGPPSKPLPSASDSFSGSFMTDNTSSTYSSAFFLDGMNHSSPGNASASKKMNNNNPQEQNETSKDNNDFVYDDSSFAPK